MTSLVTAFASGLRSEAAAEFGAAIPLEATASAYTAPMSELNAKTSAAVAAGLRAKVYFGTRDMGAVAMAGIAAYLLWTSRHRNSK